MERKNDKKAKERNGKEGKCRAFELKEKSGRFKGKKGKEKEYCRKKWKRWKIEIVWKEKKEEENVEFWERRKKMKGV